MRGDLVGREAEVATADRFLAAAAREPSALLLRGEAGIGKSALWREVLNRADARSFRVLSARADERETQLAYTLIGDLLADVTDDVLERLPGPQWRALEVALLRADARGEIDSRAVYAGLVSLLGVLAGTGPLIVAIDDAQWADRQSARALEFAVRRISGVRIGFLLTVRTGCEATIAEEVERSVGRGVVRHQMGPLSVQALRELIAIRFGGAPARPLLLQVHEFTRGNPLFALELAGTLARDGAPAPGQPLPVPDDMRELIVRKVGALPRPTREALFVAAAMEQARVAGLCRAMRLPSGQALGRLAPAQEAGIVELDEQRIRFTHPLFAAAMYSALPSAQRRSWHRRLATLATDTEQRARHLALGAHGPSERVAAALDAAALGARGRGAPEAAAELAELAIGMTPPGRAEDLSRRWLLAADHSLRAGDPSRARALLDQVLTDERRETARAQALLLLAEVHHQDDDARSALEMLAQALSCAGDDALLAAQIGVQLALVRNSIGDLPGAEVAACRAVQDAERAGDAAVFAEALAEAVMVGFMRGKGVDWAAVARAHELEDPDRRIVGLLRPSTFVACLTLFTGRLESAHRQLEAVRRRVVERGEESDLPFVSAHLAWVACLRGELLVAGRYSREAAESAGQIGSPFLLGMALWMEALVAAYRGQQDAARAAIGEVLTLSGPAGWKAVPLWAHSVLGLLELSRGDYAAAGRAYEPVVSTIEALGLGEATRPFVLPDAVEALIGVGQLDRAEQLINLLEDGSKRDRPWPPVVAGRCHALLRIAHGDRTEALRILDRALDEDAKAETPMPLERGRTLLALGVVQRHAGKRRDSVATLERAIRIFHERGAALWLERARAELRPLGGRPAATESLTPAEHRIAALVATGMTNREVAAALFLSPKTIEANLARVYRKLAISSRAELGARLGHEEAAKPQESG